MKNEVVHVPFIKIPLVINSNRELWRYVMEGGVDNEGTLDISCLDILEKDDGYLSFYHSDKDTIEDKVKHIHKLIKLSKTNPAIYFKIDVEEVISELDNLYDKRVIFFFDAGYPHIGMTYGENLNLIEIKTVLIELSEIYIRKYGGEISLYI